MLLKASQIGKIAQGLSETIHNSYFCPYTTSCVIMVDVFMLCFYFLIFVHIFIKYSRLIAVKNIDLGVNNQTWILALAWPLVSSLASYKMRIIIFPYHRVGGNFQYCVFVGVFFYHLVCLLVFETGSHSAALAGLYFMIPLPRCWDYSCIPLYSAGFCFLKL